jgi:protein MpaA
MISPRRLRPLLLVLALATGSSGGCRQSAGEAANREPAPSPVLPKPVVHTETLGRSVEGRPILLHRFGEGEVGTLVLAGIHGDEPTGVTLAVRLIDLLGRGEVSGVDGAVAVLPVANPDGAAAGTRTNARRVDVNRNFHAKNWGASRKGVYHGGTAALSEPETVAIHKAVASLKPRRIVSIHSISRGRQCNNYDGPGEALARRMAAHNGYPVRPTIGYPTPGSFGSWAGIDLRIPVITLELPRDLPGDAAWEGNRAALLEALREPREEMSNAPPMTNDQ